MFDRNSDRNSVRSRMDCAFGREIVKSTILGDLVLPNVGSVKVVPHILKVEKNPSPRVKKNIL